MSWFSLLHLLIKNRCYLARTLLAFLCSCSLRLRKAVFTFEQSGFSSRRGDTVSLFHFGDFKGPLLRFSGLFEGTSSVIGASRLSGSKRHQNTVTTVSVTFAGRVERKRWRTSQPADCAGRGAQTESEVAGKGGGGVWGRHSCQMQSEKTDRCSGFGSTSLFRRLAAEHEALSIVSGTRGASPVALLQRRRRRRRVTSGFRWLFFLFTADG